MIKKLFFYFIVIGFISRTNAQSITNGTISSAFISSSNMMNSVGEMSMVQYFLKGANNLTQGYLQIEDKAAPVISLINSKNQTGMKLYPNPATELVHVEIYEMGTGDASLGIYDASGRLIKKQNLHKTVHQDHKTQFDIRDLPAGNYFMYLEFVDNNQNQFSISFSKN